MFEDIKAKLGRGKLIRDIAEFNLAPSAFVALDIETFGENKLPGDSPYYSRHGVAGISLCNMSGEAVYIAVNDGRDYKGVPIAQAVAAINAWFKKGVKVVCIHFSKFDLQFLLVRGLDISTVNIRDTWISATIKSCGVYSSHKLKDIARTKFNADTASEKAKDDALAALGSRDYGDLQPEQIFIYACDDVRYNLMVFLAEEKLNAEEMDCYNIYWRNNLHLIAAERRGVCLNLPLLKESLAKIETLLAEGRAKIKDLLGAAEISVDNEQEMLKYLHQKNLHPPPHDYMGQVQFTCDREYLWGTDHPLAEAYATFDRQKAFQQNFSVIHGCMGSRVFVTPDSQAGFHLDHLQSVFSRGGQPILKKPDIERVYLENTTRAMFAPRKGFDFVTIKAIELPVLLLAFYCQNQQLQDAARARKVIPVLADAMGFKKDDFDTLSILLRQQIEGSGIAVLEQRMGYIQAKFKGKKTLYSVVDKFVAAFAGLKELRERLVQALDSNGSIKDRQGRVLRVDKNKYYRAHSILVSSSYGSLISYYLDMFCRLAGMRDAYLVLAHDKEFVFETPAGDDKFAKAAKLLAESRLVDPTPVWEIAQGQVWENKYLDSHESGSKRL
jgi:hypothetical protein